MASMRRKFIGTARGCGSLRGKCDQVGASELWELVDLVVHDGRGEWHRNGECCCLLSNTTLLCSVARKPRVNKQTCTLLIPTTMCLTRQQQCVWEKCLIRRLHRPPWESRHPRQGSWYTALFLYNWPQTTQLLREFNTEEKSTKQKGLVTIVWNYLGSKECFFHSMKYLAVIFRKCAWQTVMWDFPHWQYKVHCAADHLWHICSGTVDVAFFIVCFSARFLVSMQLKDHILRLQKKDRYSVKRRLANAIISFVWSWRTVNEWMSASKHHPNIFLPLECLLIYFLCVPV